MFAVLEPSEALRAARVDPRDLKNRSHQVLTQPSAEHSSWAAVFVLCLMMKFSDQGGEEVLVNPYSDPILEPVKLYEDEEGQESERNEGEQSLRAPQQAAQEASMTRSERLEVQFAVSQEPIVCQLGALL